MQTGERETEDLGYEATRGGEEARRRGDDAWRYLVMWWCRVLDGLRCYVAWRGVVFVIKDDYKATLYLHVLCLRVKVEDKQV
ncbi:hypothetical protein E2C01_051862 [Portunus trituberculatus]|uniref:Uncharacterized protein n=1 Tax=Portunus trituberculatus TaxID=210409 RepID=A0A5B7GK73_PORTR|nr:hypothetical protein [Portunus trituberculatus]